MKSQMLATGYHYETDGVDEAAWYGTLDLFADANIYQTWAYDEARCGRGNISQLILKRNDEVVAAAQARIVKVPLIGAGVAYIRWGPMWRRRNMEPEPEALRQALRALRAEYAQRRGLVLRLYPILFRECSRETASILEEEGFSAVSNERADRTLVLDIARPAEELRKGLRQHWRRYLKIAENSDLEVLEGSDDRTFGQFVTIYREMVGRKRFLEPNNIEDFRTIQRKLPESYKMKVMLCRSDGKLCAGVVCSAIGNTGVYLFGATSNAGLKSRGSYLLHWKVIEWLRGLGIEQYDLHGINPVSNPGTYKFKADLCGPNGRDVTFLGRFECQTNVTSSLCVWGGDWVRRKVREVRKTASSRQEQRRLQEAGPPELKAAVNGQTGG